MYPHCVFIDAVTRWRLYLDGMMTTVQVARHFNCSPSTVRRQLLRFGIPARRRGPAPGRVHVARGAPFAGWSADVAYVVGLIATDGNLGRKRAAISIVSKDVDLLETVRRCFILSTPIKPPAPRWLQQSLSSSRMVWSLSLWLAPRHRIDAGKEPHARPAISSWWILRWLLSRMRRRRRIDLDVHRSLSHRKERTLRLWSSLRVDRIGEPAIHRVARSDGVSA